MKVKITYQAEEQQQADEITGFIRGRYKGVKLRKSDKYPPFFHSYLAIRKTNKASKQGTDA